MQNLFSEAPWKTPWMPRVLLKVIDLAKTTRKRTVFTRFIPPANADAACGDWQAFYRRWPQMTLEHLPLSSLELCAPLAALSAQARVIDKPAYSPFFDTPLAKQLQAEGIQTLVMSGAETDVCVLSAVMDAIDLGLHVVIARDAVCSSNDSTHEALMTLYHQRFACQVSLADCDEIRAAWRG